MTMPAQRSYLRPVQPVFFPAEDAEEMGETPRHLELRTALWQAIRLGFGDRAACLSDCFVYYNGRDSSVCCAPDVLVRVGTGNSPEAGSWKTWEHGTPELAMEIVSASDARDQAWDEKLARYLELGVRELVRFDPDAMPCPLRIWDRVNDDLVERDPGDPEFSRCDTLGAFYCIRMDAQHGPWLFLSRDREGRDPYLSSEEARKAEAEARKAEAEARKAEAEARLRAEARVRELEAELRRRGRE